MKKILLVALCVVMVFSLVLATGCGSKGGDDNGETPVKVLENIFNGMGEMKEFPAFGGSGDKTVENAPGEVATSDSDMLAYTLLVPSDLQANVEACASILHAMNANTFTGACFQVSKDAEGFATKMMDTILNNQFMCGIPEKVYVASTGNKVIYAFGNGEIVDAFAKQAESVYKAGGKTEEISVNF